MRIKEGKLQKGCLQAEEKDLQFKKVLNDYIEKWISRPRISILEVAR